MTISEIWKPIDGCAGWYEVSNLGRVGSWAMVGRGGAAGKRSPTMRILNPKVGKGYKHVKININGKIRTAHVHTLVLSTFVGPRPDGMLCRHLDGDRSNNRLENLAWGTWKENAHDSFLHGTHSCGTRGGGAKFTKEQVIEINRRVHNGETGRSLAKEFGVSEGTISFIKNAKVYRLELGSHPSLDSNGVLIIDNK